MQNRCTCDASGRFELPPRASALRGHEPDAFIPPRLVDRTAHTPQ